MKNSYDVFLNFLVNLKADPQKLKQFADAIQKGMGSIAPNINLNSQDAEKKAKQLLAELQALIDVGNKLEDINVNVEGGDLSKLVNQFDGLEKELDIIANNDAFKELEGTIENINFDELEKAGETLQQSFENLDINQMAQSFKQIKDAAVSSYKEQAQFANKLKAEGKENTEEYKNALKELNKRKGAMDEILKLEKSLGAEVHNTASKIADKSFGERAFQFNQVHDSITKITGAFEQFLGPYQEFDKQLRNIGTLGVKNFEEFRSAAIDVAVKVPDTVAGVTEGIYNAISAGAIKVTNGVADVAGGIKFVEQASKLAVAGLTDTNSAIKSLAANLNAYGASTEEAGRYADILFNTVNNGVTTIPELNASLANVIPTAASFGVAFEQVAAAIATMTQQGVPTAQATTQIRAALVELAKPGAALAPIMQKAGVSLKTLKTEGLQVSLQKLGVEMQKAGLSANQVFSSVEAAGAALALSGKNAEKFSNVLATYSTDAIGSTERAFNLANEGIAVKVQGVLNQVEAAFFKLFGALGDGFTSTLALTNKLAPTVMVFSQLGSALPVDKLKTQFAGIATSVTSFAKSIDTSGGVIKGLSDKIGASGGALGKLGAMAFNPWVLGAGAAVGALTLFFTQTEKGQAIAKSIGNWFEDLWIKLTPVFEGLKEIGGEVLDVFIETGKMLYEALITPFELVWEVISTVAGVIADLVGGSDDASTSFVSFGDVLKTIAGYISNTADVIGTLTTYIKAGKEFVLGFIRSLPELVSLIGEYISEYANPVNWFGDRDEQRKALADKFSNIMSGAVDGAKNAINNANLDNALTSMLEIKGNLDKNNELDKLLKKYNATTSEMEKANIAKKIAELAPDAVTGYKKIQDEAGNIVKVMDVNIKKAQELATANNNIYSSSMKSQQAQALQGIKAQADEYEKTKIKIKELSKSIVVRQTMGFDTSEQMKEYDKMSKVVEEKAKNIKEKLQEASKVGLDINSVEFGDEFQNAFSQELNKLGQKAEEAKVGEKLANILKIKGDLDSNNKIGELVEKFNNAKSDIEKANIGAQIKKVAPDAVKSLTPIYDAQGRLVEQYEISKTKVVEYTEAKKKALSAEFVKAQEDINNSLIKEGVTYSKVQEQILAKRKEIEEKRSKGLDTTTEEKQYENLLNKQEKTKTSLITMLAESKKNGVDTQKMYEDAAKSINLSTDAVKKLVDEQLKAKNATEEQKKTVKELAEAWENAMNAAQNTVKTNVSAIAQNQVEYKKLTKELAEAKKKDEQEAIKSTEEKLKTIKEENKKLIDETKKSNNELYKMNLQVEKITNTTNNSVAGKQRSWELSKKSIETEKQLFEIAQQQLLITQKRDANVIDEFVKTKFNVKQSEELLQKFMTTWKGNISEIKNDAGDTVDVKIKGSMLDADKDKLRQDFLSLKRELSNEKYNLVKLNASVQIDQMAVQNALIDLENTKINWEIELGIREKGDVKELIELYKEKGIMIKKEIERNAINQVEAEQKARLSLLYSLKNDETSKSIVQEIENQYKERLTTVKKGSKEESQIYEEMFSEIFKRLPTDLATLSQNYLKQQTQSLNTAAINLKKQEIENDKAIYDIYKNALNERLNLIKEEGSKRLAILQATNTKAIEETNKFVDYYTSLLNSLIDNQNNAELKLIDERLQKELDALDAYYGKKKELSDDEIAYEKKKNEIIKKYEADKLEEQRKNDAKKRVLEDMANGYKLEAQRFAQEKELELISSNNKKAIELIQENLINKNNITTQEFQELQQEQLNFYKLQEKARLDYTNKELQTELETQKARLDAKKQYYNFTADETKSFEEFTQSIYSYENFLNEKSSQMLLAGTQFQESMNQIMSGLFSGSTDAIKDGARKYFAVLAGIIEKELAAFVVKQVLSPSVSTYLQSLPFPLNVLALPAITATIQAAVSAIVKPITSSLLSFSTGGEVSTPTLAIVGDASKLGGENREWIFRNDQLKQTIAMAVDYQNKGLTQELRAINRLLAAQQLEARISGEDILITQRRTSYSRQLRAR